MEYVTLRRTVRFEAAHHLPLVPENHKCHAMHGHSWEVDVEVRGLLDPDSGWVVDFATLKEWCEPVRLLDHTLLNRLLDNPTSENLAVWCWEHVERRIALFARSKQALSVASIPRLSRVAVRETPDCEAVYEGVGSG